SLTDLTIAPSSASRASHAERSWTGATAALPLGAALAAKFARAESRRHRKRTTHTCLASTWVTAASHGFPGATASAYFWTRFTPRSSVSAPKRWRPFVHGRKLGKGSMGGAGA